LENHHLEATKLEHPEESAAFGVDMPMTDIAAMNIWQRLLRYLIGILIGCVIVFLIFPDRDWLSWTPQKQLLARIRSGKLNYEAGVDRKLDCFQIHDADIQLLRIDGKIDFDKSLVHEEPKKYFLYRNNLSLIIALQDSIITVLDATDASKKANCDSISSRPSVSDQ
jgi:uncharacterized membrane protein YgaE (UPF0421/DUF939 family)